MWFKNFWQFKNIIYFYSIIVFCSCELSYAIISNSTSGYDYFIQTPYVSKQVRFWNNVFNKFNSSQFLIHDTKYPEIIIDLIDINIFEQKYGKTIINRYGKEYVVKQYINRYKLGLDRFKKLKYNAVFYGSIEKRLYNVYRTHHKALAELYNGTITIRAQVGFKDQFKRAFAKAQDWLPYMEKIFVTQGLPRELTRIVFVESMFNKEATSKAGAKGMWQFMLETGRQYLLINKYIDERCSPLKSTEAAAKFLKYLYKIFNNWPLAITAYNHGPTSLLNAVKKLNTNNIDKILQNYSTPSFGFASRNYYAEFIAAKNTYNHLVYQSKTQYKKRFHLYPSLVRVKLKKTLPLSYILKIKSIKNNMDIFKKYNSCILESAFAKPRSVILPKGFEIYLPSKIASRIWLSLNKIRNPSINNRLRF